ncbi:MAG: PIN domain-containing protein [Sphingomonas sp.]|uniref:PIN domain-containing protein n=1 Tax=Sphingomonas sp. TaxID=28214 RepID=UPI0025FEDF26|nr:PIN domain-containing protein [Sphingomonas sp.]MBX9880994.1 PIN domain-containing protein [Sphingomonas sp.]
MAGLFFDTNVLLYAARTKLEGVDALKRPVALDLIGGHDFSVSGQVLAEFYHNAVKDGPYRLPIEEAEEWLDRIAIQPCVAVDARLVGAGAALARRYQISYWDGAILAAAHHADADLLYTEDLNDGQRYGDVTVINPFKNLPH